MLFHGRHWRRDELTDRVGDLDQLGGVTAATLNDGPAAGVRTLTIRSPGGISFTCLPDRGLDIGWAEWRGTPLAWRSPVGDVAPAFAEHAGQGWLRTFGGGLLTTCGLTTAGQPSTDRGEALGLHGRYSSIPARQVAWDVEWDGDDRIATISGRIREASAVGDVVELHRTIRSTLGGNAIRVEDVVINLGSGPTPHLFRYHVNLGFPLVDEHSRIDVPTARPITSRSGESEGDPRAHGTRHPRGGPDLEGWERFSPPRPAVEERVHLLHPDSTQAQTPRAILRNTDDRPSLSLTWSAEQLPLLLVWKHLAARTYATALEPSNCDDDGRAAARATHTMPALRPGEQRHYWLELTVLPPTSAIHSSYLDEAAAPAGSLTAAGAGTPGTRHPPDAATGAAHTETGAVHA